MKITWTVPGVGCSLAVCWRSEDGKSSGSRDPTLVDLKRANEEAGLLHDYVDRDEAFEREQKLKVRIAVLEAEHAAYLDALAIEGLRPTTVMIGIESLKSLLAGAHANRLDADARGDAAIARAEKADYNLTTARERIAELEAEREACLDAMAERKPTDNSIIRRPVSTLEGILQIQRWLQIEWNDRLERSAEIDEAKSNAERYEGMLDSVRDAARSQMAEYDRLTALMVDMESRLKARIADLEAERDGARSVISVVDKVLTEEARHPQSNDLVARVRGLAAQANGLAAIAEERGKIISQLEAQLQAAQGTSIADRAMDKFAAEGIDARGVLDGIDLAVDRAKKAEALYRGACEETLRLNMDLGNARGRVASLERELSNALQRIEELDVELNRCARDAKTLAADSHKLRRCIDELEAPIDGEPSPEALDELWENARGGDHTRMLTIWRHARLAVLGNLASANKRITDLEAELDLAKRDFALANEAYDELQARFDELASSPDRIALLEALEPHDPNAARAAAVMKREHEATRAVLGARDGEDLLSAARRAVCLVDLYRTHYRRAVIANSMTDRAMTVGLAECERLRARIAELEASAAARESLRDLMEKSAEARLSCGIWIPREGPIEVGVGRGGQTYADTPQNAVWELERLLRERVGGGS